MSNDEILLRLELIRLKLISSEYFAGIGLVRMGLEACGWKIAFANDFSKKKFEMYQAFFPDASEHYLIDDIFNIDPSIVPYTTLATCSFPCIDLSLAGNMNGITGKHSSAFWGFIKVLKAQGDMSPPVVMVENVPGWLHSNKGDDFRVTVQALNQLGYACDVFTLDALRFTPQSRLRVFLIGIKSEFISRAVEKIFSRPPSLLPDILRKSIIANLDLHWFNNEMPTPPPLNTKGLSNILEQLDDSDPRWWSEDDVEYHLKMMDKAHYDRVIQLVHGDQFSYRTFYRRRREKAT
jgi:DNA (cytosine-5)-methyltransferase 1